MVTRPTSRENNPTTPTNSRQVRLQPTQSDLMLIEIDAASHGIDDGFRLLVDFLLHEMVKGALHDFSNLHFERLDGADG
jgi:hypothetical protein